VERSTLITFVQDHPISLAGDVAVGPKDSPGRY
jgi:hypothetical protein